MPFLVILSSPNGTTGAEKQQQQSVGIICMRSVGGALQVGVRVEEEDMRTGSRNHCCSAYLTFVAVSARAAGTIVMKRQQPCRLAPCPA